MPGWLARFVVAIASLFAFISIASAEVRTLKIYHLHTHEKAEIAYKKDGRYLPEGLKKLDYILRDWRRNEEVKMDPRLFDLLWTVYQKTGSHDYINVVCGYRAPETNAMLRRRSRGVARESQHTRGKAIDFFIPGVPLEKLREIGLKIEVGGVGYYPTSGSPFVHMDVGSPRHWPRMSRRQLLALFPTGKTLYVPSDGKPLPGYEAALADYKARGGQAPDIQVASASTKHKGFFAMLFGGGADQEEDERDVQVASANSTPVRAAARKPAPSTALPGVELASVSAGGVSRPKPEKREAIVAALPPQDVPLPLKAPRPEVDVGPANASDASQAEEPQIALNIPIPSRRPDYSPPSEVTKIADEVTKIAELRHGEPKSQIYAANADQLTALIAGHTAQQTPRGAGHADPRPVPTLAAFTGQLPSLRPDLGADTGTIAMLPEQRPDYGPHESTASPAVFRTEDNSGKGDRLAPSASPRLALLERPVGMSATAAIASGVRTTAKHSRSAVNPERPRRESFEVPIHSEIARWAVQHRSFNPAIASSKTRSLAYNIVRSAPRMVYTEGFQAGDRPKDASHFSGNAVAFLPVARFGTD
jgi:uncharacterized protein YcbK (DUF882 family)